MARRSWVAVGVQSTESSELPRRLAGASGARRSDRWLVRLMLVFQTVGWCEVCSSFRPLAGASDARLLDRWLVRVMLVFFRPLAGARDARR